MNKKTTVEYIVTVRPTTPLSRSDLRTVYDVYQPFINRVRDVILLLKKKYSSVLVTIKNGQNYYYTVTTRPVGAAAIDVIVERLQCTHATRTHRVLLTKRFVNVFVRLLLIARTLFTLHILFGVLTRSHTRI